MPASTLAKEHMLCRVCHNSASDSPLLPGLSRGTGIFRRYASYNELQTSSMTGCHLCSLFLGMFKCKVPQKHSSVEIRLRVSRSGGAWLAVIVLFPDKTREETLGELSVFRDLEGRYEEPMPDAPFQFSMSSTYENAQLSRSLSHNASTALSKDWLNHCTQRHEKCISAGMDAALTQGYPKRLIDVGADEDNASLKLVLTDELGEGKVQPKYLTLSHRWGGADVLKLVSHNMNELKNNIHFSELPRTFRDAIIITRQLGFQYIWIDSLCIIQDSLLDWRTESSIMGEIYAKSACTIAALTAKSSSEGCFSGTPEDYLYGSQDERNPLAFRTCKIPHGFYVEPPTLLGVELHIDRKPLPLHTRAWVLQERLLAPRTLYYGSWGLAWECVECSATENYPFGKASHFSPKASFFKTSIQATQSTHEVDSDMIYGMWRDIQASYARCQLTFFDDRLVAISSAIKRIERLTGWTNVWGLWKEKLLFELLWFVDTPSVRPRTKEYLAPTWSWIGLRGPVFLDTVGNEKPTWSARVVELGSGSNGRAFIHLQCATKEVVCTSDPRGDLVAKAGAGKVVSWASDESSIAEGSLKDIQCVLLMRIPNHIDGNALDTGLVVGSHGNELVRLGVFWQSRGDTCPLFDENMSAEGVDRVLW